MESGDKKIVGIEGDLVAEVGLTPMQARAYLLVTTVGRMDASAISGRLKIPVAEARRVAESLIEIGGFIEYGKSQYEAMHPRFTAVNMYRRICQRRGVTFGRNNAVDSVGVALEQPYEDARTK